MQKQDRVEELQGWVDRHKFHIQKLEVSHQYRMSRLQVDQFKLFGDRRGNEITVVEFRLPIKTLVKGGLFTYNGILLPAMLAISTFRP